MLLAAGSCKKLPNPDFSYMPTDNPEAGDTIFFINHSTQATSYEWSFGDGYTSTDEEPLHIYSEAGHYEVKLTAINEDGTESANQTLTINEPTILGFLVYDERDSTVLAEAGVFVYDNVYDWENINDPQFQGITDAEGVVGFPNLEPQVYHILVYKAGTGGYWAFGGNTPDALIQNEINIYFVPCKWFEDTKKRSINEWFKVFKDHPHFKSSLMIPKIN